MGSGVLPSIIDGRQSPESPPSSCSVSSSTTSQHWRQHHQKETSPRPIGRLGCAGGLPRVSYSESCRTQLSPIPAATTATTAIFGSYWVLGLARGGILALKGLHAAPLCFGAWIRGQTSCPNRPYVTRPPVPPPAALFDVERANGVHWYFRLCPPLPLFTFKFAF